MAMVAVAGAAASVATAVLARAMAAWVGEEAVAGRSNNGSTGCRRRLLYRSKGRRWPTSSRTLVVERVADVETARAVEVVVTVMARAEEVVVRMDEVVKATAAADTVAVVAMRCEEWREKGEMVKAVAGAVATEAVAARVPAAATAAVAARAAVVAAASKSMRPRQQALRRRHPQTGPIR